MTESKRMDIGEFRSAGYLQEVNRRFLHPLGLALAVMSEHDDGTPDTLECVYDNRDDPGGWNFGFNGGITAETFAARAAAIDAEWERRRPAREAELGYMVQPGDGSV